MKPKLLSPVIILLMVTTGIVFSCSKENDSPEEATANTKLKSNEWPTFTISKEQLSHQLTGNLIDKKITIVVRSDDWTNPMSSMVLTAFGYNGLVETIRQDAMKTNLSGRLTLGNNQIPLSVISDLCRINGNWINEFEYLRLTPIESKAFPGYIAFNVSACDKNGNIVRNPDSGRINTGDGESNPCPPFGTCAEYGCPAGQTCVNYKCVPN